jgi:hypothetical protein
MHSQARVITIPLITFRNIQVLQPLYRIVADSRAKIRCTKVA